LTSLICAELAFTLQITNRRTPPSKKDNKSQLVAVLFTLEKYKRAVNQKEVKEEAKDPCQPSVAAGEPVGVLSEHRENAARRAAVVAVSTVHPPIFWKS
jgi:hypothetical protein